MRIQRQEATGKDASGALEFFIAKSGALSARIQRAEGVLHLHSSIKPEAESVWYEDSEFWGDLIIFLGTGLGYHIAPFVKKIPAGAKILLVDFYPRCIDHCLRNVFSGLPCSISTVSSQDANWRETIAAACPRDNRTIQVIKHPASCRANRAFYDEALASLPFKRQEKRDDRAALLFYGNFFLEEELRRALAKTGTGTILFNYNEALAGGSACYESTLSKILQKERPGFILSVNMKGFDNQGILADTALRMGIPLVTWFVDDPRPILLHQRPFINKNMLALSWERSYLPWLAKQGFGDTRWLPLAGDPELLTPREGVKKLAEAGFVGSSMGRAFLDTLAAQFLWKKELEPVVASAARSLLADKKAPVWRVLQETCAAMKYTLPFTDDKNITWLCSYIIHTASMLRRKALVSACLPHGLRTFGDPEGWRALLGNTIPTWPDIDYRSGIADIYQGIDVTINITSCQMPTAVNQRVFDVPLSGGFIINDHQADLDDLFAPSELALYESEDELVSRLTYYQGREAERRAITQKARAHILAEHTYDHRIDSIRKFLP